MNDVIGEILPLAIAITISPISIIAVILLLFTRKPIANAAAYLIGFAVGMAVVLTILTAVAGSVDLSAGSGPSQRAATLQLVVGVGLLFAAFHQFRGRPKPGGPGAMPKWMDGISGFAPGKSLAVGAALGALNPKNLVMGVAAAVAIASGHLSTGQRAVVIGVYTVIAALGVAAPLVVTIAMRDRAQPVLDSWKAWLSRNNAVVMSVLLLVFAVIFIDKGIAGG